MEMNGNKLQQRILILPFIAINGFPGSTLHS